jgi:hypothetical protein
MHPERKYWPTDDIRRLFDDPSFEVPGQPNYRNRPGRSGLDAIDFRYEYAHIQGRVVRMLLDRKWYTGNPFMVIALSIWGLAILIGLAGSVISPIVAVILISPFCLIPFVLYFLIVPPLLMRFYRLQDSLDDEDEDWDEEEFDA